jgi:hypothetical protein
MGGGGGGWSSVTPERVVRELESSADSAAAQEFESRVAEVIAAELSKFNDRDTDSIQTHLATIKQALNKDADFVESLTFGGSVQKHTYVDGLSDVDALVALNTHELEDAAPSKIKEAFAERLRNRLPGTKIEVGSMAVTVQFADAEIQLVPVIRRGRSVQISDEKGEGWTPIQPRQFARKLREVNQQLGYKLVPVIKLAKAVLAVVPEDRRLIGYHTEALALRVFADYNGPLTPKAMLMHFFKAAPGEISQRIQDRTRQSRYVDEYLGAVGSLKRELAADAIDRLGRRMRNADSARSVEMWRDLLRFDDK